MSLESIVVGYSAGIALIFIASQILGGSEDQLRNWAASIMFAGGLISIVGLFAVIFNISDNAPYAYLTDILGAALTVVSVVLIIWALLELILVFYGVTLALKEVVTRFLSRIRDAQGSVNR